MVGYEYNDGGKSCFGWEREHAPSDCATRAFAIYSGLEYGQAFLAMQGGLHCFSSTGSATHGVSVNSLEMVLNIYGLTLVQIASGKPTLTQAYEHWGNCIVTLLNTSPGGRHHVTCILDGDLQDTVDLRLNSRGRERKVDAIYLPEQRYFGRSISMLAAEEQAWPEINWK